jgi:hypothetical protein
MDIDSLPPTGLPPTGLPPTGLPPTESPPADLLSLLAAAGVAATVVYDGPSTGGCPACGRPDCFIREIASAA